MSLARSAPFFRRNKSSKICVDTALGFLYYNSTLVEVSQFNSAFHLSLSAVDRYLIPFKLPELCVVSCRELTLGAATDQSLVEWSR